MQFAQPREVIGISVGDDHRVDDCRFAVRRAGKCAGYESCEQLVVAAVDENDLVVGCLKNQAVALLNVDHRQPYHSRVAQWCVLANEAVDCVAPTGAPARTRHFPGLS